ncbi:MAG TPA: YsnF/AvaK domain-containing protein [Candidatus Binataceae bacterium]|nr:YsnF/AvaK domain-containing protein [Candidatus Binataceae bacterium]
MPQRAPGSGDVALPLYAEDVAVARRTVEQGGVRVSVETNTREHLVDEQVTNTRVEVKRIPIGRTVQAAPPVRTEGDTIIIPVLEETIVVERRLVLKEEIILRRVRTTEPYRENVTLREQEAVIVRVPKNPAPAPPSQADKPIILPDEGKRPMTNEIIVAVFDREADAAAAVAELHNAGVPPNAVTQHVRNSMTRASETSAVPPREPSFWERWFGGEPEHKRDTAVYNRSLEDGSTIVTVHAEEQYLNKVMDILQRHDPVDIDERGAGYVDIGAVTSADNVAQAATIQSDPAARSSAASDIPDERDAARSSDEKTLPLAEETLAVGKRAINRGTTRVRRYVVETPVEEQVKLRSETVAVERHPVTGSRPVSDASFTDKVVEMTETDEEPVVSKRARVKEEVVIHKDTDERVETVRDTVRREEAEVTKDAADGLAKADLTERSDINPDINKH